MANEIVYIKIVKKIWKIILPLISLLFLAIYLLILLDYLDVKITAFESFVFVGGFIGFSIMSFLSYRLKIKIDYIKKEILIISYRKKIINFENLKGFNFEEQRTIDFNIFYYLFVLDSNKQKIKVSLSFSAFSKKGFITKKNEIYNYLKEIISKNS